VASEEKHLAWIVAVLGIFHGLFVAGFPLPYSMGAGSLKIVAVAVLGVGARYLSRVWRRGIAWGLLAAGLGAFALRIVVR